MTEILLLLLRSVFTLYGKHGKYQELSSTYGLMDTGTDYDFTSLYELPPTCRMTIDTCSVLLRLFALYNSEV